MPPVAAEGLADLGILLVHGIGDQAQGETLTKMTEPLIAWIRQWLRTEEPAGSLIASAAVSAALRPPLLDSATPAHARVLLGAGGSRDGADAERREHWLLAEAWWAPQVLPPPLGGFAAWLLICAPWVSLFHFSQLWLPRRRRGWRRTGSMALVTPLWLLWSLAVSAVLIVLYPLALIPIGRLRAVFYSALRRLSGIVGDAYVKIRHPLQRRAMEDATIAAMHWLAPRCQRLVVIAHSQGAAIAHGALQRAEAPHTHLFVTVGSGMAKLSALRFFQELSGSDRLAAVLAPPLALAAVVVALRLQQPGMDAGSIWWPPVTLGLLALAFVVTAWVTVEQARADLIRRSRRARLSKDQVARWCDIVATRDPVPAGNITDFFCLRTVEPTRVDVLRSMFQDHTSYWSAGTLFMPKLVEALATCSGSKIVEIAKNDSRFEAASRILLRDLRFLRATDWVDALAVTLPLLVATDRVVDGVSRARLFLRGGRGSAPFAFVDAWLGTFAAWVQWLVPVDDATADRTVNLAAAAALLLLARFAWRRMLFAVWSAWSANRTAEAFRRVEPPPQPTAVKPSDRLASAMAPVVVNVLFLVVAATPIVVASLWTYAPGLVSEAGLYWAIGMVPASMFFMVLAIAILGAAADEVADTRRALSAPSLRWLEWPTVRDAVKRASAALFALALALVMIGTTLDVAKVMVEIAVSTMGVLIYVFGLLFTLERVWQLMGGVPPSLRTALMFLPLASGVAGAVALSMAAGAQAAVGALLSVAGALSVLSAGILWAVLRIVLGRPQVGRTTVGTSGTDVR